VFVVVDCVGSNRETLIRALVMLASDGASWNYCGRSADADDYLPDFGGEREGAGRSRRGLIKRR
jgi:hypothetical protein